MKHLTYAIITYVYMLIYIIPLYGLSTSKCIALNIKMTSMFIVKINRNECLLIDVVVPLLYGRKHLKHIKFCNQRVLSHDFYLVYIHVNVKFNTIQSTTLKRYFKCFLIQCISIILLKTKKFCLHFGGFYSLYNKPTIPFIHLKENGREILIFDMWWYFSC